MTSLHEVPNIIRRAIRTGTNLELLGNPAIGKTSIIEQTIAQIQEEDKDFAFQVLYTPSLSPLDFVAVIPNNDTKTLTAYHNEILPNRFETPDMRGVLFLGERNNADPATNKALQKYINNEDMGGLQKPEGVIVISDSNKLEHKSGVVQQSLALLSRSRIINIDCVADETIKYFHEMKASSFVLAFITLRKEFVDEFDELMKSKRYSVWANPRAWMRLSKSLLDCEDHKEKLTNDEIIGDIGEPVGREFIAFMHAAKTLVPYKTIVKDPENASKPTKISDIYAVIAMLGISVQSKDFKAVRTYVERYGLELQVLFLRLLANNKSANRDECINNPEYTAWFQESPELIDAIRA